MINKLNKDDRLEFLIKSSLIENKFNTDRILTYLLGVVCLITVIAGLIFIGFIGMIFFLVFAIRDMRNFFNNKRKLIDEYFEIKPRGKK